MANYTTNYNLEMPEKNEFYNVDVQNQNMQKIDTALSEVFTNVSNGKQIVANAITDKGVVTIFFCICFATVGLSQVRTIRKITIIDMLNASKYRLYVSNSI